MNECDKTRWEEKRKGVDEVRRIEEKEERQIKISEEEMEGAHPK